MFVMLIFDLMLAVLAWFIPDALADCMDGEDQMVSIHAQEMPVVELIQSMHLPKDCSLLIDPQVQGEVSVDMKQMPWFDALTMVGVLEHLSVDRLRDVVLVREEKNKAKKPPLVRRRVKIKHGSPKDIVTKVTQYLKAWSFKHGRVFEGQGGKELIVYEQVEHMQALVDLIEALDVAPLHIRLTGKLMYVQDEEIRTLGFNWGNVMGWHMALPGLQGGQLALYHFRPEALMALEQSGRVSVVARPLLITESGVEASIESGEQIPYQEKVSESGLGLRFKKAVLKLAIKPTQLADGRIHLNIELNQDQVSPRLIQGVPGIQTQHLQTQLVAKSGEVVVLGGVYRHSQGETFKGLPRGKTWRWLHWLLGEKGRTQKNEQLLIMLTPAIL